MSCEAPKLSGGLVAGRGSSEGPGWYREKGQAEANFTLFCIRILYNISYREKMTEFYHAEKKGGMMGATTSS